MPSSMLKAAKVKYASMTAKQLIADAEENALNIMATVNTDVKGSEQERYSTAFRMLFSAIKIGFDTEILSDKQKHYVDGLFLDFYDKIPGNAIYNSIAGTAELKDYELMKKYSGTSPNELFTAHSLLHIIMSAAYADGALSLTAEKNTDLIFNAILLLEFAESVKGTVPFLNKYTRSDT